MSFLPFINRFPQAPQYGLTLIDSDEWQLPAGEYLFIDNHCSEKDCDCRKVMINIIFKNRPGETLATIGFGWEPLDYYVKWMFGKEAIAKEVKGPILEMSGRQSKFSRAWLEYFRYFVKSQAFLTMIKNHYWTWREMIDEVKDDDPCICGSEDAYIECCGEF